MLFNSIEFLIFLPVVFLLYWFVFNRNVRLQNAFIVAVSYLFYGWWDWRFLLLIAFTSIISYANGLAISRLIHKGGGVLRCVNIANITLNLAILGIFKYYNFFAETLASTLQGVGIEVGWTALNVILPVGVSFYTFQALSYTIDVYKQRIEPTRDIVELFAYVSFFPQLVAGPIERAKNLLPQFARARQFDYTKAVEGCRQILWGFFKKIVIADCCATGANAIFASYNEVGGAVLIVGALLFAFQIYGDFSGYSDIAIGCSRLFGIELMRNFNLPYFARDIAEFWRRWHISLTTWFRDYLYFPLGGSRGSRMQTLRNTFIIFLVSGLWHGANWTYVAWGAYHAMLFVPLLLLNINRRNRDTVANKSTLPSPTELGQMLITFTLVIIGWIIFRSNSIYDAVEYITRIFTTPFMEGGEIRHYLPLSNMRTLAYALPLLIGVEWCSRERENPFHLNQNSILRHRAVRWITYYAMILFTLYNSTNAETFIYFQF